VRRKLGGENESIYSWGHGLARSVRAVHARDPIDVFEMEESFGWFASLVRLRLFPVVVKLHGPAFLTCPQEELGSDFMQEKIAAEGMALAKARAITAPSLCALSETVAKYVLRPRIAAHVVNPLALGNSPRIWSIESSDRTTLLFVGRFDRAKGADRVLTAFKALLARRPELRLLFVGPDDGIKTPDGDTVKFAAFVASLFDPEQRERIVFMGAQPRSVIASLRCEAALTIVASRWESQGYTALEAMLQGCPLVCADTSGLSESVTHQTTGLLFDGDDINGMVTQIQRLLDDPLLGERLGRSAREYVLANHGAARVADQTLRVYQSAIADFGRAAPQSARD
jgi:glycosyltransferase involved in cell wall biosynthesis